MSQKIVIIQIIFIYVSKNLFLNLISYSKDNPIIFFLKSHFYLNLILSYDKLFVGIPFQKCNYRQNFLKDLLIVVLKSNALLLQTTCLAKILKKTKKLSEHIYH